MKLLNVTVSPAFWWELRVPNAVRAIVVDGPFLAHPPEPLPLSGVEVAELRLVPPSLALSVTELSIHSGLTSINVEALVSGYEGSFGPICLLQTTPCGPVICIPQAVVDFHGLVEWEFDSQVLAVLEHPDWDVINKESADTFWILINH